MLFLTRTVFFNYYLIDIFPYNFAIHFDTVVFEIPVINWAFVLKHHDNEMGA